jgi:DNA-binding transcriptional MerR regulator
LAKTRRAAYRDVGENLKIGDVARRLGISASMLRTWEKLGVVCPHRTKSSYRVYTSHDLRVLRRAVYLRRSLGLNAPAIVNQLRQEKLLKQPLAKPPADPPSAGPLFRKLRRQRGEPLAAVAQAVGVSIGFLSNLERSQTSVSIATMRKLAQYYGLNIIDFFSPTEEKGPLVRARERGVLRGGEGVQMELLASGKIMMEPHLFRVAPGAGSGECYSHAGEEFLYLTRGQLVIVLENREYPLAAGDSFYFESKIPHRWFNPGKKETEILWINTPPTF